MSSRLFWIILLVISSGLFIYGLIAGEILATIVALILAIVIQKFGYEPLFSDYDQKQQEKVEKLKARKKKN